MSTAIRFGVSMPNGGDPAALIQLAVDLESAGWDGFYVWDHLQLGPADLAPTLDPWVLLGAIAARTTRLRLGTLVTPVPRRRPWKLAKEIATLDQLSGGRVVVGVGLGVPPETEYAAFGEPAEPKLHAAKLDEALPVLDGFLRGDRVEHTGEHYQVEAQLAPAALQRPRPPIWVAAMLPYRRGVERARRWDGIFPLSAKTGPVTPAGIAELVADLAPGPDYDVVAALAPHAPADELADAGATWAIDGPSGPDVSFAETRARLLAGPPGRG